MSDVQVRPFRRGDRDQLTQLVNAHAEAVVPGMSVSVNTVLGSLERRPGEFIEDPWGVTRQHAGGELPVPGVYGVPEQWPHVAGLYQRAGFTHTGHTEVVYLARVQDLPGPDGPPLDGLAVRRSVGINGCRLSAVLGAETIGYIETEILDQGERLSRHGGWADVGNLHVVPGYRRRGVGSWLLGRPPTGSGWPG